MFMTPTREFEAFRVAAALAAGRGGKTALARLGESAFERKADHSPVTETDHVVQALVARELIAQFPEHSVLGEERRSDSPHPAGGSAGRFCWVVDPVDGTRNFSRGMKMFATSVALLLDGAPIAGAIFDASSGDVYSAAAGDGACCNERPLRISDRPIGPDTSVAMSSFRKRPVPAGIRKLLDQVLFRNIGAACLHQAWIAAGYIDAIYAPDTRLWDVAAGALIIAEAGGVVTDEKGRPRWPVDLNEPHDAIRGILAGTPTGHALVLAQALAHVAGGL